MESRHNLLKQVLADGFAKGDIKNKRDLQTYCNLAKRRHDFDKENLVCPYECAFGQRPCSTLNLVLKTEQQFRVGDKVAVEHQEEEVQTGRQSRHHSEDHDTGYSDDWGADRHR